MTYYCIRKSHITLYMKKYNFIHKNIKGIKDQHENLSLYRYYHLVWLNWGIEVSHPKKHINMDSKLIMAFN